MAYPILIGTYMYYAFHTRLTAKKNQMKSHLSAVTELFDFTTFKWQMGPSITLPLLSSLVWTRAVALDENKVVVFGGINTLPTGYSVASTFMYDFATNVWSQLADMNNGKHATGNGRIRNAGE